MRINLRKQADMPDGTCSVATCDSPRKKREWCYKHYRQWRKTTPSALVRGPGRPPCTVEECEKPNDSRGFCSKHLYRWRQYGDPLGSFDFRTPAIEFFWSKVEKTDTCWLWRGSKNGKGYGGSTNGKLGSSAHRIAYILLRGPVPDDPETGKTMDLDHLCRVKICVNPDHLEPVTHAENIRRGLRCGGRETCGRGHSREKFTVVNINGHRFCGECAREDNRKRYNAKKPRGPQKRYR